MINGICKVKMSWSLALFTALVLIPFATVAGDLEGNGNPRIKTQNTKGDKEGNGEPRAGDKEGNGIHFIADPLGNGGYAAYCTYIGMGVNPDYVESLDIAEARFIGRTPVDVPSYVDLRSVVKNYIGPLLSEMRPEARDAIYNELKLLTDALQGKEPVVSLWREFGMGGARLVEYPVLEFVNRVPIKADTGTVVLSKYCKTVPAIAQYSDEQIHDSGVRYKVSASVWADLDLLNQAAFLFHEVLYREILKTGKHNTSQLVRDIVSLVFTVEGQQVTSRRRVELLSLAGLM